jgi:hypothetical protein
MNNNIKHKNEISQSTDQSEKSAIMDRCTKRHNSIHSFTGAYSPGRTFGLPFRGFLFTHIQTHGRTPLDEWSARRRNLYLHRTTQHINTRDKHPCPERGHNSITGTEASHTETKQASRLHVANNAVKTAFSEILYEAGSMVMIQNRLVPPNTLSRVHIHLLGEFQDRSGSCGEENNLCPCQESRAGRDLAVCYATDWGLSLVQFVLINTHHHIIMTISFTD